MTLAGVAKFVLGVSLAIAILMGSSVLVAVYFMYRVTTHPPKPVFANEKVTKKVQNLPQAKTTEPKTLSATQPDEQPISSKNSSSQPLTPGTYKARVIWQQGLSLRTEPSQDAERIGGLEYNQQIVVLEESADKSWQKVRLTDGEEGWIKTGNIERIQTEQ
jgi:uncharacterized protein YgiM (DUF1202 family)